MSASVYFQFLFGIVGLVRYFKFTNFVLGIWNSDPDISKLVSNFVDPIMKKRSKREIAVRKAHIDGFRPFVMYPSVGSFKGCYHQTDLQGYGVKTFYKSDLVYDGQWLKSKCHGQGTLRRLTNDGTSKRIYIGQWFEGKRCGEGKMFHKDGIYYGWWKDNKPHGKGIMWYDDGRLYIGQWEYGLYHGAGILFYMNGNRYEGNFENGLKHGEGLFFHNQTGQLQKGVWCGDMCKTSIMFDEFRNQATSPTPYPIPKSKLFEPDNLVKDIFKEYLPELPVEIKGDLTCIDLITKVRMKFVGLRM